MKTITLICSLLWAVAAIASLHNMLVGDSSIFNLFTSSPMYAIQVIVGFLTAGVTALFFFVLWSKQN